MLVEPLTLRLCSEAIEAGLAVGPDSEVDQGREQPRRPREQEYQPERRLAAAPRWLTRVLFLVCGHHGLAHVLFLVGHRGLARVLLGVRGHWSAEDRSICHPEPRGPL